MVKKGLFYTVIILLFFTITAQASQLELFLIGPQKAVQAGEEAEFTLVFHNLSSDEIKSNQYNELICKITLDQKSGKVRATLTGGDSIELPGNGFVKKTYRFKVPENFVGNVKIALAEKNANHVVFMASVPSPKPDEPKQVSLTDATNMFQPFVDKLSSNEPMYFLVGIDPGVEKTSFQLSFKYQLFSKEGLLGEKAPWINNFYFAYTQKSLWDLDSDSKPFEDTSYKPELFYLDDKIDLGLSWVSSFGVQAGYQHESNGQDGPDSRSTNFLYIKPIIAFPLGAGYHLKFAPKVWAYVNNDDNDNGDLSDYRGYFELETKIGNPDSFMLGSLFRNGDEGSSYQLDLTYPLSQLFGGLIDMYIHAQYFNGYAETLLNYNEKDDAFRLGISIVR
ncbi:MAG: phospholipase A [Desulfobacterales bacterium]|nr:phospholipase A [Desulfobacterales bacterium]